MWLSLIYAYNAKNVDSKDVIYLKNPSHENNAFGHSVALAKNYVFVGAPHDANHGNVFKCSFKANDLTQQNPTCYKVDGKCTCESKTFFWIHILNFSWLPWTHDEKDKQKSVRHDSHCFEW